MFPILIYYEVESDYANFIWECWTKYSLIGVYVVSVYVYTLVVFSRFRLE